MKLTIHGRNFPEPARPFIQQMFDELSNRHIEVQLSHTYRQFLNDAGIQHRTTAVYASPAEVFDSDFAVSVGGDGTLLDVVTHVGARQTPIVGINTGRLGFLATTSPDGISAMLQSLTNHQYTFDDRTLVSVQADRDLFGDVPFGLNDFTITRTESSSMITVHTYLDGQFLNSYWADGLIVSTPTGSTGYSLSAGGPVLLPQTDNFIITPISPHNLNVRPMVVMDTCTFTFEVESRSGNFLVALDSRSRTVDVSTRLTVQKEAFKTRLLKFNSDSFLDTLRSKLNWGLDIRN